MTSMSMSVCNFNDSLLSLSRFINVVTIYELHCNDNTIDEISVFSIAATPVQYQIANGNAGGTFGIHNTTGLIYIACALDYEKIKKVSELKSPDSYILTHVVK
jgi:hypothetical protein